MIGHQAHKNITASRFGIIVTAEGWSEVAALTEMNKPLDTGRGCRDPDAAIAMAMQGRGRRVWHRVDDVVVGFVTISAIL